VLDGAEGFTSLRDLLAFTAEPPPHTTGPADPAVLPLSSGTTGRGKGVVLTHRNLVANLCQVAPVLQLDENARILAVLPFFHIYGMTVLLNAALHARARLVIMPSFDLGDFLGNIANHRCTFVYIAPPVAVALAKHPLVDSYDLSSLRAVLSGAASLDADLGRAVADRLNCTVSQGYGMSELSPVSHITPHDGGLESVGTVAPLASCGWTVPNGVSKLVDPDTGNEIGIPAVGLSETGELWFRGPNVMAGYLNNDAATRETIDADGYLHTGDLAQVDSNGCVYVVDRLKELIKYKGYQVPPAELEAVLLGHPAIADAAVIGVQDSESGEEVPKAFVVKQPSAELSAEEVMAFVASLVAPYKKVRQVEF
ncbi:MAG: AMP-binding protein, partial [Actinomycetes bacterium]